VSAFRREGDVVEVGMRYLASTSSALLVTAGAFALAACSGGPGRLLAEGPSAALPVYGNDGGSISSAGQSGWTTPPAGGSVQPAPVPVTSTWSAPPAPPPAPAGPVVQATPYTTTTPTTTYPYTSTELPCPPAAAPARAWSGCGLPCADGLSQWHVRGVLGYAFYEGDDPADSCLYWGFDVGRTFCGCWGLDLFYRYHSGQFDRAGGGPITEDGGAFHHIGVKATYERAFGQSRFYWWAGIGPEYFWTEDYIQDDSGFGIFGEAGIGYVLSRNFRLRLGVNVHAMDTDVGRLNPADDGESRWLFVIAPVVELELAF
jgi:hypothetical protein